MTFGCSDDANGPADRTPDEQEEMFEMFGLEEDDDGGGHQGCDSRLDQLGNLLEAYERLSSSLLFTGESENFPESSEKMFRRLAFALEPARGVKKSLTHEV